MSGSFAASPGGTPEYSPWRGMAGSMSKSSFAMDRPGSIYGGGLSTLGGDTNSGGGYHSRSHSLAGLSPPAAAAAEHDSRPTSPYSASTSYPIDSTSLAELGVAVPPRVASPDAISEAGASNAPPSSSHRQRTMSSSSSTMTLRRSYAGDYYSSSRRNSALFGSSGNIGGGIMAGGSGGAGPSSKRDSYLPHLPSNRDAIQIVPPQPLGIGLGGLATAMDQKTLAFSKSSGIGLGEEAFGDGKFSWNDATGQQQQDQQAQTQHQHQRSLSPSSGSVSGSGSIGPQQLHRYLQEGPLGRNSEAARRSPWEATSGSGGYAGVPPVRGGTPQSSHYNGTTANSSPILGAQQQQHQQGAYQHNSKPLPSQPHSSSDTAAGSSSSRSASGTAGSPSASGSGSGSGGSRSNDDDVNSPHHTHNDSLSSSMTTTTKTSHHDHHGSPVPGDAPPAAHKLGGDEQKATSFAAPVAPLTTTAAAVS